MTPLVRAEVHGLFVRLANGERAAIAPAFALLWPLLRDFTGRALGAAPDAEDAAQRAAIVVFEKVAEFDASRDAVGWALAIAASEVRSVRRRSHRRREEPIERGASAVSDADPERDAVERDLVRAARGVLGGLKDEDLQAIVAHLAEERPVDDSTFRKRLQRATARLREAWRAKHGTP